ncbi:MAG: PAS domain S-box protein [Candidatus Tectomicrobia bacterium]|nr:PAS domain S-box protein [Candidatus Tectomicrobia bacterium]
MRYIHPLGGNEAALGHDLRKEPHLRAEAELAIRSRAVTLAGPFMVRQDGAAVILLLPLFFPDAAGGDRFWGFAAVVVRLSRLVDEDDLRAIQKQGFNYALWRLRPDTQERQTFARSAVLDLPPFVTLSIKVPNATWTVAVAPRHNWWARRRWALLSEAAGAAAFSSLLTLALYMLLIRATERGQAREHLQKAYRDLTEAEAKYRDLYDNAPDLYVSIDRAATILSCNQTFADALGYRKEELIGASYLDLVVAEEREECRTNIEGSKLVGQQGRFRRAFRRRDGSRFVAEVSARTLPNAAGEVVRTDVLLRDIGARLRVEAEADLLHGITRDLAACEDFRAALRVAVSRICKATGWDYGAAWAPDRDGQLLEREAFYCCGDDATEEFARQSGAFKFSCGAGLPGRVWASRRPEWIADVAQLNEADFPRRTLAENAGLKGAFAAPVGTDDQFLAVLVFFSQKIQAEDQWLLAMVSAVTAQVASALRQKQAEAERARLATAVEQSADSIFITDAERNIQYVNPAFERTTGYTSQEALGQHPRLLKSGLHDDTFYEHLWKTASLGRVWKGRIANRNKDGSIVTVDAVISPVFDASGRVVNFVYVLRDISDRVRVEAEADLLHGITRDLAACEDFRAALQVALSRICQATGWDYGSAWVPNREGKFLERETFYCRRDDIAEEFVRHGGTLKFAIGEDLLGRVWASGRPEWIAEVAQLNEADFPHIAFARQSGLKGAFAVPVGADDKCLAVLIFFSLKTQAEDQWLLAMVSAVAAQAASALRQKQAEAERARLAIAVEQSADSIFITDAGGTIQYVNPAFERITGYTSQEALGRQPRFLRGDQQEEAPYKRAWRAILHGKVWSGRLTRKYKNGKLATVDAVVSPVFDASDRIVNFVHVARDITHQLALEGQLRHAERLSSLGTLAAGAAHEILNPANIIGLHSQGLLARSDTPEPLRRVCAIILDQIRRISLICDSLRRFSRAGGGGREVVSLNGLIEETLQLLGPELRHFSIEVVLHLDPQLPDLLANRDELAQVILNLCTNARDAMPDGGRLDIHTETFQQNEAPWARLVVKDSGIGMPEEVVGRIFDPFFTTKPTDKGTGLGLSVVHGIIESHGGGIKVASEPGAGSAFTVELPQAAPREESPDDSRRRQMREFLRTIVVLREEGVRFYADISQGAGIEGDVLDCLTALQDGVLQQVRLLQRVLRLVEVVPESFEDAEFWLPRAVVDDCLETVAMAMRKVREGGLPLEERLRLAVNVEKEGAALLSMVAALVTDAMPETQRDLDEARSLHLTRLLQALRCGLGEEAARGLMQQFAESG